jgi:hypothetical protein
VDRAAEPAYRQERLEQHNAEPIDYRWARSNARVWEADLAAFGETAGFQVTSVDCRTTTCLASLVWPTYRDARKAADRVIQKQYTNNCAKELFTPSSEGLATEPYKAALLLDCEQERAAQP